MKLATFLAFGFALFVISCNQPINSIEKENTDDYTRIKTEFDKTLISQFPENLSSDSLSIAANTSPKKNNVGLMLYEYQLPSVCVDSIYYSLTSLKLLANYHSFENCLLIVNRFETKRTAERDSNPIIVDSSLINRKCYDDLYPVPNFVNYNGKNETSCGLDSTFTIYVLDAKAGHSEKYTDLKPFPQMPKKWGNGYSKGFAVSRKNRTIIYWSIEW